MGVGLALSHGRVIVTFPEELASSVRRIEQIFSWLPDVLQAQGFMFSQLDLRKSMAIRDFTSTIIVTLREL